MHVGLKLPFEFDPIRLKADLLPIRPEEWAPHYNESDYGGDWRGVALRSCTGIVAGLDAGRLPASAYRDTPLLRRCAYFREVLSEFRCSLKAVRLLSLAPGSFIREHSDHALVYEDGELRIHVPVQTGADVDFYVDGERLALEEGCSYYVNVNLPHRVNNRGTVPRIHLVIDAEVGDWARELIRGARGRQASIPRAAPRTHGFERFREVVLDNLAIQRQLRSIGGHSEFQNAVVQAGCERGFDFTAADVDAESKRFASKSRGAPNLSRPPASAPTLLGWTPTGIRFHEGIPFAEWIYTGQEPFTRPFFEDDLSDRLRSPFTATFRQELPLDVVDDPGIAQDCLAPAGFIFHMSRCGSTLVSQMLACLNTSLVISEAPVIDCILQAHLSMPELSFEGQIAATRRIVTALGRRRTGRETRYFIKLDSWHAHRLPLLRAAFPDTPLMFLFRDPVEVMLSQLRVPGLHCAPGLMEDPRVLGLNLQDIARLSREEWCAAVLAGICESALAFRDDPQALFVDYAGLPDAMFGSIAPHFSLSLDRREIEAMRDRARFHGKTQMPWPEANTQETVDPRRAMVRDICAARLLPLYEALRDDALRSWRMWQVPPA